MPEQVTHRVLIAIPCLDGHDRGATYIEPILDEVRGYCFMEEICNMLHNFFDEYRSLQW